MTDATPADRALELFRRHPPVEYPNDWIAEQLLAIAAESGRLSLRILPSPSGEKPVFECSDCVHTVATEDPVPIRFFRNHLARFAKKAEAENGTPFEPYGGTLHFDRIGPAGPVRLEVEFENTTRAQMITIVKGC